MRLFLGSFLDKELIEKIPLDEISKLFEGNLKPIRKENIHLTWIFLGEVKDEHLDQIIKILDEGKSELKELVFSFKSLEFWPPSKKPRLIVIGGELNRQIVLTSVCKKLNAICNPDIKEDFLPHITVARFKKDKTVDRKIKLPELQSIEWYIKNISLVQSTLNSDGPHYKRLRDWT